jgi:hypothetical protein
LFYYGALLDFLVKTVEDHLRVVFGLIH